MAITAGMKYAYQEKLVDLLLQHQAFRTGIFKLKSGATSPYFVNFGRISDAAGLAILGEAFADCLVQRLGLENFDMLVGPAYKGISLAIATGLALHYKHGINKLITYNRKEKKSHGEDVGSVWVGGEIPPQARLVIVDDVFTTGATKLEMIKDLNEHPSKPTVVAMLVGVDRQQPIQHGGEEMQRFCDQLGVKALPVVQVLEVIEAMVKRGSLNSGEATKIKNYVATGVL